MVYCSLLLISLFLNPASEGDWKVSLTKLGIYDPFNWYLQTTMMAVADDGTILLTDGKEKSLLILGTDGKKIGEINKQGSGPGEIQRSDSLAWIPEANAFYILDGGNNKISVWNKSGKWIKDFPLTGQIRYPTFRGKDHFFCVGDADGKKGSQPKLLRVEYALGAPEMLWQQEPLQIESGAHFPQGGSSRGVFHAKPLVSIGSDFVAYAWSQDQRIRLIEINSGKIIKTKTTELPTIPMTDDYWEFIMTGYGSSRAKMEKRFPRPENWPWYAQLIVDREDQIWVSTYQDKPSGTAVLFGYDREGKLIFKGRIGGFLTAIIGDTAYYVTTPDNDELFIRKLDLKTDNKR